MNFWHVTYTLPTRRTTATSPIQDSEEQLSTKAKLWADIEKLFEIWDSREAAEDEIDDEWLDNLRGGWNRRLKELYDSDDGE